MLTVGFPNIGLQGFAPKLAKGEVASLSGAQDDARYFQISVPVQPGNSGGAFSGRTGQCRGRGICQAQREGGIVHEWRSTRERELCGEEQLSPELPGIGAGSGSEAQGLSGAPEAVRA